MLAGACFSGTEKRVDEATGEGRGREGRVGGHGVEVLRWGVLREGERVVEWGTKNDGGGGYLVQQGRGRICRYCGWGGRARMG